MTGPVCKAVRTAAFTALAVLTACNRQAPSPVPEPAASTTPAPEPVASAATGLSDAPDALSTAPAAAASAAATGAATFATYAPRDDCSPHPGWEDFRARLSQAVARQDPAALAALASPDVKLDFGGGSGAEELRKRLSDPHLHLWDQLSTILTLGCGFQGGLAAMPWIFWNVPDSVDPYQGMLVLGEGVSLRKAAEAKAPEIAKLDWTLVEAAPHKDAAPRFLRVTIAGTKTSGYVATSSLRSLLDYRLIVEPDGENWHITAFIAGD